MSRKQPEIKVIYPDASPAAMLLTDAMIRRSTGKRVVETNSEEKEYTGEMLFGGVLSTKTDTSVELTLRLNPDVMDYALTTLIAKNLTEEEKRAIRMETDSMEIVDLLSPAQAAAGQDTSCTEEVGTLREPTEEEANRKPDINRETLRDILVKMLINYETSDPDSTEPIDIAIDEIDRNAIYVTDNTGSKLHVMGGEDYSDIERLVLNCLNDHLPDADYLTKTGLATDMTRRLKLNIDLRLRQHKAGLISGCTLRMILHDLIENLGGSGYPKLAINEQVDQAVETIDEECRSVEVEDAEATNVLTSRLGLMIRYILALNDNRKDKRIHALFVLSQDIQEWIDRDVNLNSYDIERAMNEADRLFDETPPTVADPIVMLSEVRKFIEGKNVLSWDDVEAEARQIGKNKTDKTDKTDDIEPGLLNDIEDKTEGEEE